MNLPKVGRNDPCPCGSGKKYKNCHYGKESTAKTYTATGKRKFKAKVLSLSDKTKDLFQKAPPMPSAEDLQKDDSLKFKATSKDYRAKGEEAPILFPQEPSEPIPEAKPFEPLQIPEGEFKPTDKDYKKDK